MIREGYKQTEIGIIPEDWEVKRLGEVVNSCVNGTTEKQINEITDFPVTRIETISNCVIDYTKVGYIRRFKDIDKYELYNGDILFSHINSIKHIGKAAFYNGEKTLYHGMNLLRITANREKILPKFLYNILTYSDAKTFFELNCKKAINQASLNQKDTVSYAFPLPPLAEQKKIADILSCVDDDISEVDSLIEKTQLLKKGLMQQLLTKGIGHTKFKQTELGEIPESWEVKKLGEVCDVRDGTHDSPKYIENGIPFVTSKNLKNNGIDFTDINSTFAHKKVL